MSVCEAGSARLCSDLNCKDLAHKLAAWRSGSSSLGTVIPGGWAGSPSRWALERRHVEEMTAAGMSFDRPSDYSSTAAPRSHQG